MINWPIEVKESKYKDWYDNLIQKAQARGIVNGYKENHHVIPRCFGGDNSKQNIVQLTAREHYIAHALLWKMKFSGVYGGKMAFAFNTFINKMTTEERGIHHTYKISSRTYEVFRKHYSQMLKEKYALEGGTFLGRKHSEETKRKIGEKSKLKEFKRGPDNPNWGKPSKVTPEGKLRQISAVKSRWADPEFKKSMLEKRRAYLESPEGIKERKATADRRRGVKRDPAIMEKIAAKKRGKKEHEIYSPEAILKRKEGLKNRVLSAEAKEKIRQGSLKGCKMPKTKKPCPHCGKMCAGNMLAKWHGDNCKKANTFNSLFDTE